MKPIACQRELGWSPFIWLIFLSFFFFHPAYSHVGWREWALTIAATVVFLALYFSVFWIPRKWALLPIAGMILLGMLFAPSNGGASTFFVFAAAVLPFVLENLRWAFWGLAGILAVILLESWILHLSSGFWLTSLIIAVPVGLANIYFAQKSRDDAKLRMAQEEIEHLAKVGSAIEAANRAYNNAVGSFEQRVLPGARKFRELGVQATAELPDIEPTGVSVRQLAAGPSEDA